MRKTVVESFLFPQYVGARKKERNLANARKNFGGRILTEFPIQNPTFRISFKQGALIRSYTKTNGIIQTFESPLFLPTNSPPFLPGPLHPPFFPLQYINTRRAVKYYTDPPHRKYRHKHSTAFTTNQNKYAFIFFVGAGPRVR